MYYDAHTHLNASPLYDDRKTYYDRFLAIGGKGMTIIGMDPTHNQRAIELAEATAKNLVPLKATLGIHPYEIGHGSVQNKTDVDKQIETIKQQIESNKQHIVAIGEWWLDAHYQWREHNRTLQEYAFTQQCILAETTWLPLVIHSRDAFEETLAIVTQFPDVTFYFHCRWYDAPEVVTLAATIPNLRVGFCGNLTYPKAEQLRRSLQKARDQSIPVVFETDAPYLAPQPKRGLQNEPAYVHYIYDFAAELLGVDQEKLCNRIEQSILSLYSHQ